MSAGEWGKRSSEGWGVRAQMWGQVIGGGGGVGDRTGNTIVL